MRRITTDSPKDNIETALNLFYIKDNWTWVRGGGPAPEFPDVSLCDYVRDLAKKNVPDLEFPSDDYKLSDLMAECLMDGTETMEGVFATLYTAGWAFAELRHKLKAYEDTGLDPKVIMEHRFLIAAQKSLGALRRLREVAEADQEGRVIVLPVLPCNRPVSSNEVFFVRDGEMWPEYVTEVVAGENSHGELVACLSTLDGDGFYKSDIGKTVFLTQEEAEKALKSAEMKEEGGIQ